MKIDSAYLIAKAFGDIPARNPSPHINLVGQIGKILRNGKAASLFQSNAVLMGLLLAIPDEVIVSRVLEIMIDVYLISPP